jgi:hypothetical protein
MYSFIPYKMTIPITPGLTKTSTMVHWLASRLPFGGFRIWLDNLYNTPALAMRLFADFKCYLSGTWRVNYGVPEVLKRASVDKNQVHYALHRGVDGFKLLGMKLRDNKVFYFITSWLTPLVWEIGGSLKKMKLRIIHLYNKYMNAVDRFDQRCENLNVYMKSVKWWKVLWSWSLNVAIHNAHIIYSAYEEITRLKFHLQLIDEIVEKYGENISTGRQIGDRYVDYIAPRQRLLGKDALQHFPYSRSRRRCVVCFGNGSRKETPVYCRRCDVNLCIGDCYQSWHSSLSP